MRGSDMMAGCAYMRYCNTLAAVNIPETRQNAMNQVSEFHREMQAYVERHKRDGWPNPQVEIYACLFSPTTPRPLIAGLVQGQFFPRDFPASKKGCTANDARC